MNFSTANLIENYANRECLEQLGWSCVPELDCNWLTTWAEISNLAIRKGYETQPLKQWFAKPLALRNQGVFTVDNAFCREVENIGSKNQWSGLFRKYKLKGTTRKVSDMDTHQYFTESAACNLHMGQLVQYQIPIGLQFCSTDAILTQQQWYTKGHVEEGGAMILFRWFRLDENFS